MNTELWLLYLAIVHTCRIITYIIKEILRKFNCRPSVTLESYFSKGSKVIFLFLEDVQNIANDPVIQIYLLLRHSKLFNHNHHKLTENGFFYFIFRKKSVAKYLINAGADVLIPANNGCTAFDMASLIGNFYKEINSL